jgi:hypothetical protein
MNESTITTLNHLLFTYVFERYKRLGREESGAYDYYADRIEKGCQEIINKYEYELPVFIEKLMPKGVFYVGAGFGFLAIYQAIRGLKCSAIESDNRRFQGLQELSSRLSEFYPQLGKNLTLINSKFPNEKFDGQDLSEHILLFANFASTMSDDLRKAILTEFPKYKAILLSERLFGETRESLDEREKLSQEILSYLPSNFNREDVSIEKTNYFAIYKSI